MAYSITGDCIGCTLCARICPVGAIRGAKKQPRRIVPELCLECGACGRICPARAVRDPFGRLARGCKKQDWKKPVFDPDLCMACGICIEACPAGCLELEPPQRKNETARPVLADPEACLSCGFCVRECPLEAVVLVAPFRA